MAHQQSRAVNSRSENELWFTLPSARRQEQSHPKEQSAYRATSSRNSYCQNSSVSPPRIPTISTTTDVNKPLPLSPTDSEKRKRTSASWRALLHRQSSGHLDPNRLQPLATSQRHTNLTVDTQSSSQHNYSRSMPNSPFEHYRSSTSGSAPRASSAAGHYFEQPQYQPYSPPPAQRLEPPPPRAQRATSMNTYFEQSPPRARTFPDTSTNGPSNTTARETISQRPRPHTWLSPTEPFADPSQFNLFAEAMTGLPNESDPFSPTGPPQVQGSLFARRSNNDVIPIPLQNTGSSTYSSAQEMEWQHYDPPSFTSRSVSAPQSSLPRVENYQQWQPPSNMGALNAELEMLGLDGDGAPDDELPDYAQSQAEMDAKKRAEASARARELEARWRGAHGR